MRDISLELMERFERLLASQSEILQILKPFMQESKSAEAKVEIDADEFSNPIHKSMLVKGFETVVREQENQIIQEVDKMASQDFENLLPPIEYIYKEIDDDEDDEDEIIIEFIYPCDDNECSIVEVEEDIDLNYITDEFRTHVSSACYVSVLTAVPDCLLICSIDNEWLLEHFHGAVTLYRSEVGAVSVRLVYDPGISISEMLLFKH